MAIKIKDIVRGTTRVINATFLKQDGTPHDLTGAKVFFAATQVSDPSDDSAAAINIDPLVTFAEPLLGKARIVLSSIQTRVPVGTYFVGVQAVLVDGTVIEETGEFDVAPDYKISNV